MKLLIENWRKFINEAKKLVCPKPTQDLELNTKNRNAAIQAEHIQYGPLNLADEEYWERAAEHWNTEPEVAKKSRCSNCIAFDISPRMLECLPGPVSEPIEDEEGKLGYCWMHHFKCHSARACYTWAGGGPISEDEVSAEWQEKGEGVNEAKDPAKGTGKKPKGSGRRLYTDEDPSDTVSVKFKTVQDIKDTLSKESFKSKSHKRQSQIINLIHQRVRAAYKNAKDPDTKARLKKAYDYAKKRKEASKEKTKRMNKEK
mgnify:CR=1 FL=1